MRNTFLLLGLLALGLVGCEGSLGFQAVSDRSAGGGSGGPVLLGAPDAGDAAVVYAADAGVFSGPDAYSADVYTPRPDAYAAPSCTPSCTGRSCGSDGCGGSCGSCATGSSCSAAGMCTPDAPPTGQIVVFGTSSCGYCRSARAYFTSRGIPFRDVSLSAPGAFEEALMTAEAYGRSGWSGGGMPFIKWPGAAVPANFTNGFSESLAAAHGF